MSRLYHAGNRTWQDRFDTRRLADRIEERLDRDSFDADDRAFVERMEMFFLATADEQGMPQCSYKGGDPGFVRVVDDQTIAFPNYDGNGTYLSMGNLLRNPQVGILFIDFESPKRLRVNGIATIDDDDPLLVSYPRPSSSYACEPPTCYRIARVTCTAWRSSSAHASFPTSPARRPCPIGSGDPGRATCSRGRSGAERGTARLKPGSSTFELQVSDLVGMIAVGDRSGKRQPHPAARPL